MIIETKPASWRGVSFLMVTSTVSGGVKHAVFNFPNSSRQTIEPLGTKPRDYSMTVIIPHFQYDEHRDDLLRVLEDGQKGPLEHPFYGKVENIRALSYTITEKYTALGRAEVTITFGLDNNDGVPQKAKDSVSECTLQNQKLLDGVQSDVTSKFSVTNKFLGNFADAKAKLDSVTSALSNVQNLAATVSSNINAFATNINNLSSSINQLIGIPSELATSIRGVFSTADNLFASVEDTYKALTDGSLFDFGDNDTAIQQTTAGRIERAQNHAIINEAIQTHALGYAMLNVAQINFQTTTDIDTVSAVLDTQYIKIVHNATALSRDTLQALTDLRTITFKLFNAKSVDARRIVQVYTHRMPMSVLAYQYYGSTDLTDTLIALNTPDSCAFVEGYVNILTE